MKQSVCIYVTDKKLVDKLVSRDTINIANQEVIIRRLVTLATRGTNSRISPTIPNYKIENILNSHGIQMVSTIKFLRVIMPEPEYSNVKSFSR